MNYRHPIYLSPPFYSQSHMRPINVPNNGNNGNNKNKTIFTPYTRPHTPTHS